MSLPFSAVWPAFILLPLAIWGIGWGIYRTIKPRPKDKERMDYYANQVHIVHVINGDNRRHHHRRK